MSAHTEYLDWLASIKPGDRVLTTRGYGRGYGSATVAKVTATQFVLNGGGRYQRKDGCAVGGDGWTTTCLLQPTTERLAEIALAKVRHACRVEMGKLLIPTTMEGCEAFMEAMKAACAAMEKERITQ